MNNLSFFLLVLLITFLLTNPMFNKLISGIYPTGYDPSGLPRLQTSFLMALIVSLLIFILYLLKNNKEKEGFFFEVSQPQPKCEKGYYGKNVNFEFTQPGNQECSQ